MDVFFIRVLVLEKEDHVLDLPPTQDASHYQDSIFSRESHQLLLLSWVGGSSKSCRNLPEKTRNLPGFCGVLSFRVRYLRLEADVMDEVANCCDRSGCI